MTRNVTQNASHVSEVSYQNCEELNSNTVSISVSISGIDNCSIISPIVQESNFVLQNKIYAKCDSWFTSCQLLAFQFKMSLEYLGGTHMRYDAIACKWAIL